MRLGGLTVIVAVLIAGPSHAQDAGTWMLRPGAPSPAPRWGHASDFAPAQGLTIIFGGSNSAGTTYNDTWGWNGTSWISLCDAGCLKPTARYQVSMVYDAALQQMVLFSGLSSTGGNTADTWQFDGQKWLQVCTSAACSGNVPQGRHDYGMAYDPGRQVVVLYGGTTGLTTDLSDTWEFDGATWVQRCAPCTPGARAGMALAWDGKQVILFGGEVASAYQSDTWSWDGNAGAWIQLNPSAAPPARQDPAAAYDSARGRVILYGGTSGSDLADTWEWDGVTWSPTANGNPPPRTSAPMAFDTQRRVGVLMGGISGFSSAQGDTWEYRGPTVDGGTTPPPDAGLPNGASCNAGILCASGYCSVDMVCCDSPCTGQCQACNLPDAGGTCTFVTGSPVAPRPGCVGGGPPCGGSCDGVDMSCVFPDAGTVCAPASCTNGFATPASTCAAGLCIAQQGSTCDPYVCNDNGTGCAIPCLSSADCVQGYICDGNGYCVPAPDAGSGDAGSPDAGGVPDGGPVDAGPLDGGVDAGGPVDAGFDAGTSPDAGADSGAATDAGPAPVDSGSFDGGPYRPVSVDLGCGCGSGPGAHAMACLLALLAVSLARRTRQE